MAARSPDLAMKELETVIQKPAGEAGNGFRVSSEPVVESYRGDEKAIDGIDGKSDSPGEATLSILARDPKALFVYWSAEWIQRLGAAGVNPYPVHLRVLRADGTEEGTTEIDPSAGFAFVEVSSPGAFYTCELGCFEDSVWKGLARSEPAETPAAAFSDDPAADFATLPFHLSFQRLVEIFRATPAERQTLAESVWKMQTEARALQASISAVEWSKLIETAAGLVDAESAFGLDGVRSPELAALLRTVKEDSTQWFSSPEKLKRWRELGERFGGSSWAGAGAGGASWSGESSR